MKGFSFQRCREPKLLVTYSIRTIFVQCLLYPVAALVLSFILGSLVHPEALYSYKWTCGIVHLPSISRVINLPLERTIFQLLILFSVPFRLFALLRHWHEFRKDRESRAYSLARKTMVVGGLGDIVLLSLLSVVGERESGGKYFGKVQISLLSALTKLVLSNVHVLLFALFAAASYLYFISMCLLTRWAYSSSKQETQRKKLQVIFLASVTLTIPIIFIFFILYNVYCVPSTYEFFVIFEYATVAGIYGFHVSSFWKMTGSIRVYHSSLKMHSIRV